MRTFNGRQPWEQGHAPRELAINLQAYRRAMLRSPKWSGRLRDRRRFLRQLAREIGPEAEERLELLLELMQLGHAEMWRDGPPDPQAPAPVVTVHWSPAKRERAEQLLPGLRPLPSTPSEPASVPLALVA